jgi:kynureninase
VAERHLAALDQPLTGWFAHAAPFAFADAFARADGIRAMLCSTPQMLSMVAFEAALDAFDGIRMAVVQQKGCALGDLMMTLADERLAPHGVGIASLRDGARRGNHVSLTHAEGYRIMQALIARGVIGDFRASDIMRFGFGPLYVRYVDVFDAVLALEDIVKTGAWKGISESRGAVT